MDARKRDGLPDRLEELRQRFERWRQKRTGRSRIPEPLWASATRLASRYGIHQTCRALRLNYYALKERVEELSAAADPENTPATPTFLELAPAAEQGFAAVPPRHCECLMEWEDGQGGKMRVQLKGIAAADLITLSRSWWEHRA